MKFLELSQRRLRASLDRAYTWRLTVATAGLSLMVVSSGCGAVGDLAGPTGMDNYNRGVNHQATNETLAEQDYKIALQQNPDLAEAHLNLGLIYMNSGWLDGAEQQTRQAATLFEKTHKTYVEGSTWQQSLSIAYNNLGLIEMSRGADSEKTRNIAGARSHWQAGMADFRKAVDLDPTDAKAQASIQQFKNAYY